MNIGATAVKFGVFTAVSTLMVVMLYNTMANKTDGATGTYRALFADVSGLRTGDDVRVAGVKVGRVEKIEVAGRDARVEFSLSADQPLLTTTDLVIRYQNLLGQRYVSMVQVGERGERLREGATVPLERTSPGFDLTALLNGFRPLFAVLEPEDVNRLSESIIKVLQGEGGTVELLLRQTARLTNFLADREELFDEVITNLVPVLRNIEGQGTQLQSTVQELSRLMDGLARNRKVFGRSLDSVSRLANTTDSLLREARRPLVRDLRSLRRFAGMYVEQSELFGSSIAAFGGVVGLVGTGLSYRSALNAYLCSLAATVVGVDVLGTGNAPRGNTKVCRG
jgi:phospholipid/cholesterol/gamma-HCH transport system substrate-binding protein